MFKNLNGEKFEADLVSKCVEKLCIDFMAASSKDPSKRIIVR